MVKTIHSTTPPPRKMGWEASMKTARHFSAFFTNELQKREMLISTAIDNSVKFANGTGPTYLLDYAMQVKASGGDLRQAAAALADRCQREEAIVLGRRSAGGYDCTQCSLSNRLSIERSRHTHATGHRMAWAHPIKHGYTPGEVLLYEMTMESLSYGRYINGSAPDDAVLDVLRGHTAWLRIASGIPDLDLRSSLGATGFDYLSHRPG